MSWLNELFHVKKPIIAMCHLQALPGDPRYDASKGMEWVIDKARKDMNALQNGGVDAIMFSNEFSLPYLKKVEPITISCMASIIGQIKKEIRLPYGVNVLWDPEASIDVAVATGASFVREIFSGVYASDFGLWNTNCGETVRHQHAIGGSKIKLLFNILPEAAKYLADRDITEIAKTTVFNHQPDALCISGITAGAETSPSILASVKKAVPDTPIFVNTGVKKDNVKQQLAIADGAIVGTAFKKNGLFFEEVDQSRVEELMSAVSELRNL
jgi:hypothetical protein